MALVVAINSSGRAQANSSALVNVCAESAAHGHELRTHELSRLKFIGCTGCGGCRVKAEPGKGNGPDGCVIRDELTPVLGDVAEADVVIMGAPIYYSYVSGIFKSFLDRWYGYRDHERNLRTRQGRLAHAFYSQGHPDPEAYLRMTEQLEKVYIGYGFEPGKTIASGLEPAGMASESEVLLNDARAIGVKLANALKQ